jgi:aminoglycoside 6'-N-acetyltransferase
MVSADLVRVRSWLSEPHVASWYLAGTSLDDELEDVRRSVAGGAGTHVLVVEDGGVPVGWCQWYRCSVDPTWASQIGAAPGDVGIDYAIGSVEHVGRGLGTAVVAALVHRVRWNDPRCTLTADPDERNVASRRVLEKNGFVLHAVRVVPSEPTSDPMAIYRLPGVPGV